MSHGGPDRHLSKAVLNVRRDKAAPFAPVLLQCTDDDNQLKGTRLCR